MTTSETVAGRSDSTAILIEDSTPQVRRKIAMVVHGRFHAVDLTRALLDRGHDATLYTITRNGQSNASVFPRTAYAVWPEGVASRV